MHQLFRYLQHANAQSGGRIHTNCRDVSSPELLAGFRITFVRRWYFLLLHTRLLAQCYPKLKSGWN